MELTSQQEDLILEQARERHFEENRKHEIAVEERHNIDEQKEAQADLIRKYDLSESDESEDEGLKAIREHESCIDE